MIAGTIEAFQGIRTVYAYSVRFSTIGSNPCVITAMVPAPNPTVPTVAKRHTPGVFAGNHTIAIGR
jgi:hypothetical protein